MKKMDCEQIAKTYRICVTTSCSGQYAGGLYFLSGGMAETEASQALNEINKYDSVKPWRLTFSYGRALQSTVLETWKGIPENFGIAQVALLKNEQQRIV